MVAYAGVLQAKLVNQPPFALLMHKPSFKQQNWNDEGDVVFGVVHREAILPRRPRMRYRSRCVGVNLINY